MNLRYLIPLVAIFILLLSSLIFIMFLYSSPEIPQIKDNTVVNVVDGDTFDYYDADSNTIERVRLLCVDTSEKSWEGYKEAKDFLESLILDKEVILKSSITEVDKYNRLLRYVYVEDSGHLLSVNKVILDSGYGRLLIIPPEECKEMN